MNNEQIETVVSLYSQGLSSRKIAVETGISGTQVRRLLKMGGVKAKVNKKTVEEEKVIFDLYMNGESSESIAKKLGVTPRTVTSIVKRCGGAIRPATENKRTYAINKDFFKKIDSEEKSYALGFMYADGNVHKRLGSFNITLHKKDRDVLDMFNSWIYVDVDRVEQCNDDRYVNFRVSSVEMVADLVRHGCVPAKTFKLELPDWLVESELFRHFVRGFLDGDGCIRVADNGRVTVIFTGYDNFVDELADGIKKHIGVYFIKREVKPKIVDLRVNQQELVRKFLHWLYYDASVFMRRKREKAELAMSILDEKATKSLKSNTLLTFNGKKLSAKNILAMSDEERDCAAQYVFDHFRARGFPYDRYEENELVADFKDLVKKNCNITEENRLYQNPEAGLKIFRHFCDHYYEVCDSKMLSLYDAFYDDEKLMKAIKNRMGYFFEDEAFNITGRMIRQGLRNGRIAFAASVFKPSVAKFFYKKFEAKRVLDISAGFGQRMLGATAAGVQRYVATDPWDKTISILTDMKKFISSLSETSIELIHSGSEHLCLEEKFDFCFSSPPFFNKEIYSKDVNQAYYGGYEQYLSWWEKTMRNVHESLLDGSYFVLNMDPEIAKDMIARAGMCFKLEDEYFIGFKRGHLGKDSRDVYHVLRKI